MIQRDKNQTARTYSIDVCTRVDRFNEFMTELSEHLIYDTKLHPKSGRRRDIAFVFQFLNSIFG